MAFASRQARARRWGNKLWESGGIIDRGQLVIEPMLEDPMLEDPMLEDPMLGL